MATVPKRPSEKVTFYQVHLAKFAENAAELGLTPEEVADLQEKVEAAKSAYSDLYQARMRARSMTFAYKLAIEAMANAGAAIVGKIRATARAEDDPAIMTLASLPQRAKRSPIDKPGTPTRLTTSLHPDGTLRLKWACPNPRGSVGTVYQIYRREVGGEFVYLACVGTKSFRDETIPKSATRLEYQIQAVRSTKTGVAATFPVFFGSNGAKPLPKNGYTPRYTIAPSLAA